MNIEKFSTYQHPIDRFDMDNTHIVIAAPTPTSPIMGVHCQWHASDATIDQFVIIARDSDDAPEMAYSTYVLLDEVNNAWVLSLMRNRDTGEESLRVVRFWRGTRDTRLYISDGCGSIVHRSGFTDFDIRTIKDIFREYKDVATKVYRIA